MSANASRAAGEKAEYLAKLVTVAHVQNAKIKEQDLFLLFNGRYLISSDGKLVIDAVSGKPVTITHENKSTAIYGAVVTIEKKKFDYSYERQAIKKQGGLPEGLYTIECKESGSLLNGNIKKHLRDKKAWGNYHWQLIPDDETDTRNRDRNSFTIHGGDDSGSAGCIDVTSGDTTLREYLRKTNKNTIKVYVQYDKKQVVLEKEKHELYPLPPPPRLY